MQLLQLVGDGFSISSGGLGDTGAGRDLTGSHQQRLFACLGDLGKPDLQIL